jgi:hypothetical protein
MFEPHYYLKLPRPVAAEYFVGMVDGELVAHLAVTPRFEIPAYRATRLVVMPEWQGAGVGTKFLNWVCSFHKSGGGRKGLKLPTYFHTSHPQLCTFLKRSPDWRQVSAVLNGGNKKKSAASIKKTCRVGKSGGTGAVASTGYGGHFRAVQGFKYIGK